MSQAMHQCMYYLVAPSNLREIHLEKGLPTLVLIPILSRLARHAREGTLPSLQRLRLCTSEARLNGSSLSEALEILTLVWPALQVTTQVSLNDGEYEMESDEEDEVFDGDGHDWKQIFDLSSEEENGGEGYEDEDEDY
ncbi:hypothetical protein PENSPDRAFT_689803 [Peniophora sp. CONT]|nr:hypothetical protein PENSPDRAFT_689803 [Peniophora sp. CONT]